MNNQFLEYIQHFTMLKILVIGEAATDINLVGMSHRVAREAPVPIVEVRHMMRAPGRAANAAVNAAALGASTTFLSVTGNDDEAKMLRGQLRNEKVKTHHMPMDDRRDTQTVQRVMAGDHLLVRFDTGTTAPLSRRAETRLIHKLRRLFPRFDAVLVSDYGYGIMGDRVIATLAELQHKHQKPLVIDSKYLDKYRNVGATIVKPNYQEAITLLGITKPAPTGRRVEQLLAHRDSLLKLTGAMNVAVTLDIEGAVIVRRDMEEPLRTYSQPMQHSKAVGAGDTYSAALALAMAAGAELKTAADIAQAAACVVVRKTGTTTCHYEELYRSFSAIPKYTVDRQKLQARIRRLKAEGKRVVFTNGCFDILHSGHISYLEQAKQRGDVLVVALNSDASVQRLKGAERPINMLSDRVRTVAGLSAVDIVTSFSEDTPEDLLKIVQPDLFVKGGDYTLESLIEAPLVEKLGGEVAILPFVVNRSTTNLISRIRNVTTNMGGDTDAESKELEAAY